MTYTNAESLAGHNGVNPAHVPGGYDRWYRYEITPGIVEKILVRPRNPGRWLGHEGGAKCGPRPLPSMDMIPTRQIRRQEERRAAKVERAKRNERFTRKRGRPVVVSASGETYEVR